MGEAINLVNLKVEKVISLIEENMNQCDIIIIRGEYSEKMFRL